jgi:hypothetical protein
MGVDDPLEARAQHGPVGGWPVDGDQDGRHRREDDHGRTVARWHCLALLRLLMDAQVRLETVESDHRLVQHRLFDRPGVSVLLAGG